MSVLEGDSFREVSRMYSNHSSNAGTRRGEMGCAYQRGLLGKTALLLAFFLLFHFSSAQPGRAVPEPAPTDAVKESGQTFQVEGRASSEQGPTFARYAALLNGYAELLKQGLSSGLFEGAWVESGADFRFFRVDVDHPYPELFSWVARTKVVDEEDTKEEKVLTLESPTRGSLAGTEMTMRAMATEDVDRDGLSDVVAIGYDGAVYFLKEPKDGQSKVMARSPSMGLLELVSGPGYERMRAVLPQDIVSVEAAGEGYARVMIEFEILESVNSQLLGRTVERREMLLSLEQDVERIRFSLSEPTDFSKLNRSEVEIRGTAISEKLLQNVDVRHNGTVAWESPEGIGIRALQFNLERMLQPGWNNFRISARDQEGFVQIREIWLEAPENAGRRVRGNRSHKRAVLVFLDKKAKDSKIMESLTAAGFPADAVTILKGEEVGVERVLAELRQDQGADELLFYCEAVSHPGELVDGKGLIFADGVLTPSDLAQSLEAGGYEKVLGLFHTELPRDQRNRFTLHELWRDTNVFLDRVGGAGRLMLANRENFDRGTRSQRKRSRQRLMTALKAPKGDDLEKLVDLKEPAETLFRGWMFGKAVLAP